MQHRGLAANTIRQRTYLVRKWLGVEEEMALPARRTVRETKWLDAEQVRAVLSVIPKNRDGPRDFALLAVLLVTGLRMGQVRAWKVSDIRCSGGSARMGNEVRFLNQCPLFHSIVCYVVSTIPQLNQPYAPPKR